MIKAKAEGKDGRPLYIFGLSGRNLEKLRKGLPIKFAMEPMGGVGEVLILFGETEQRITADLFEFIGPDTKFTSI